MKRIYGRALASVAAAALAVAPIAGASQASVQHQVNIQGFTFQPPSLTVASGDAVRFTNNDFVEHTATVVPNGFFDSGPLSNGQSAEFTFASTGTHEYYCSFHTDMRGVITVVQPPDPVIPEAALPVAMTVLAGVIGGAYALRHRRKLDREELTQ